MTLSYTLTNMAAVRNCDLTSEKSKKRNRKRTMEIGHNFYFLIPVFLTIQSEVLKTKYMLRRSRNLFVFTDCSYETVTGCPPHAGLQRCRYSVA
jgi:hypothetical protein